MEPIKCSAEHPPVYTTSICKRLVLASVMACELFETIFHISQDGS